MNGTGHQRSAAAGDDRRVTNLAGYGPWAVIAGGSEGVGAEFARQLAALGSTSCWWRANRARWRPPRMTAAGAACRCARSRWIWCSRVRSAKSSRRQAISKWDY
ncbi:short chain oxidoreductase domain protein [Mycobacterium xenopi 4042]|uniref:Short chain oxidoreductase domain protein n=1 Tax=Mycobacterium xenopi 4042 TaxID=1299334 RepID=X8BM41_MYCXE|nr:short chain oxidoreductase domain protein [Mycobacterium xenopi 4042]